MLLYRQLPAEQLLIGQMERLDVNSSSSSSSFSLSSSLSASDSPPSSLLPGGALADHDELATPEVAALLDQFREYLGVGNRADDLTVIQTAIGYIRAMADVLEEPRRPNDVVCQLPQPAPASPTLQLPPAGAGGGAVAAGHHHHHRHHHHQQLRVQ